MSPDSVPSTERHSAPTSAARRALCEHRVTLNGQPARVTGVKNAFAHVTNLRTGESYEWAWETVARIVAQGGEFTS